MKIRNHLLEGIPYRASPNRSGPMTPIGTVYHYTAGISFSGAVSWLTNPAADASAHIVVGEKAEVVQLVPFNVQAWHAGPSRHPVTGQTRLNDNYIGIEISHPGPLRKIGERRYTNWDGKLFFTEGEGYLEGRDLYPMPHARVGSGMRYWPEYTDAQLDKVEAVTRAILAAYPSVKDAISHEAIDTRGWKTDPGPTFPMGRMWRLFGRRDGFEGHLGQDYYLDDKGEPEAPPARSVVPPKPGIALPSPMYPPAAPEADALRWRVLTARNGLQNVDHPEAGYWADYLDAVLKSPRP